MKFRTDFVTNSSDSSFLTFNVKNKKLFNCLTSLGIKFEDVNDGEFSDSMKIILPSGEEEKIDGFNNWSLPYITDCNSISAWLVAMILWEVEDQYPSKEEDDYSDFAKELIKILDDADIIHLDWDAIETWSRESMIDELDEKFGEMDGDITDAAIEHTYGFEGEVGPCIYTEVHDGQKMSVDYSRAYGEEIETEDCDGLKFVVAGKLNYYDNRDAIVEFIEEQGGKVVDSVSKNTDYLICNDINSTSSKMKKAKALGIPVLSELAFIRRFADVEDFDDIPDEESVSGDAWELTSDGGVLDFVMENGTQPIVMEVWKDGSWQRCVSEQKNAAKNATALAKREEAKNIILAVMNSKNGKALKRLLRIKSRDCLTTEDPALVELANVTFEEMCENGSIRFEIVPVDQQKETDCYICVQKEESKSIFGENQVLVNFDFILKHNVCDLDHYKNRAMEAFLLIIDSIDGENIDGTGNIHYQTYSSQAISDEYEYYSLMFKIGDDIFTTGSGKSNAIKGYEVLNRLVTKELLKNSLLKKLMGIENVPDEEVYQKGYIRLSEALVPSFETTGKSWLIFDWNFGLGSFNIVPVCAEKRKLAEMASIIKNDISGLNLPERGKLSYLEEYSRENIKLSDELLCSIIYFKIEK